MAARQPVGALVVLHDHHRDVVELDRVGQRDQRAVRGADLGRLVVVDPVADILDAGLGEQFRRVQVWVRPGPSQPTGRLPVKASSRSIERVDHAALVLDLVDRPLLVGMAHELPAGVARLPPRRARNRRRRGR